MIPISFTKSSHKEFNSFPSKVKAAISMHLEILLNWPETSALDIKKLKTPFMGYRLRVGTYRILFTATKQEVVIYSIKHRKDAYR